MRIRIKQKWGFLLLFVVTLIYISISFFDDWNQEQEVKEIYFADKLTTGLRILIDKYNRENEGVIKVIPIDFPNDDFSTNERKEILARLLRGGVDEIDVFAVDLIWVQRFTKWCEPLDNYFTEEEISRIIPPALESCYFGGELYALPIELVQGVFYYRDDLVRQHKHADKIYEVINGDFTWDKFVGLQKLLGQEPYYIFPAADYEGLICSFVELVVGLDPDYFNKNGFYFETPEAEKALSTLVDLVNGSKISPRQVVNFSEVPSYEYFLDNDYMFIRGWQSYDKDFTDDKYDIEKQKNLKKCFIPRHPDGNVTALFGGWNIMVSKFSNNKEEAIDFIKFLIREESQEVFYFESGYLPINRRFYEDQAYVKKYPEIARFKEMLEVGVHRPAHENYTKYSKIMSHYFEKAVSGQINVKAALSGASNAIRNDRLLVEEFSDLNND